MVRVHIELHFEKHTHIDKWKKPQTRKLVKRPRGILKAKFVGRIRQM
jgi:hypothetical protein